MEKLLFKFILMGSTDGKTNVICITSIETPDGRVFEVPDELRPVSKHTAILSSNVYTKIKNSLKKRHQSRTGWIPLNSDLKEIYLDEGENLQFGEQYLDEIKREAISSNNNTNSDALEQKNIGKIADRFLMEKFSNKTINADQWISEFESECGRFEIINNEEKIEILKHRLEKQCVDWYSSMLIKLTVNSEWAVWKDNFCETFGNKGWSQVKYAFTFRFQAGSLLEYATKKERLLLEVNKHIDIQTMMHLIVMGLPDYIVDKIDKETVKSTASLYNEIGKHEHVANKNNISRYKKYTYDYKGKANKTKPCRTCENLNKVKIKNVLSCNTTEDITRAIRNQNKHMTAHLEERDLEITEKYRRKARNPLESHVVLQVTPKLWQALTSAGRIHVDLQRTEVCSHCGGAHMRADCQMHKDGKPPSCINCKDVKGKTWSTAPSARAVQPDRGEP
ncbi:uncharacterized protein LOC125059772 [Pieris napi]|uniref:uncharacterized protein LOC125059772 n=1 Tax=Pieris napi TaxID=78633 RepID=UPI001FBAC941|nr:uncharacterized protein LOC125059772 [Pieris napi]